MASARDSRSGRRAGAVRRPDGPPNRVAFSFRSSSVSPARSRSRDFCLTPRAAVPAMPVRLLLLCLLFRSSWLTVEGGRRRVGAFGVLHRRGGVGVAGAAPQQECRRQRVGLPQSRAGAAISRRPRGSRCSSQARLVSRCICQRDTSAFTPRRRPRSDRCSVVALRERGIRSTTRSSSRAVLAPPALAFGYEQKPRAARPRSVGADYKFVNAGTFRSC